MGLWQNIRAALVPTMGGRTMDVGGRKDPAAAAKNLSYYISPVQLARVAQDIKTWRDAMDEAENAWYPQRVRMQRLYLDTILNGHVYACKQMRENLTLLKEFRIVDKKTRKEDEEKTKIFKSKWFREYMRYVLEAKAFGYSLIYFGDLVNGAFPKLSTIRRFNISPDRLNVQQFIYSIDGAPFLEQPYADWHIWVDTPTDVGVSNCGYGYLYKVGSYEIFLRNVLSQNIDATEMFGMPIRVGKTSKKEDSHERAVFEQALAEMGSAGYILMDSVGDEVELMESKSLGNGYKIYESLENRILKMISKIILGHADALDSVPGKLGNDSEKSPAQIALMNTATVDMNDVVDVTNNQLIPRLIKLGFNLTENDEFEFSNNDEVKEQESREDEASSKAATTFKTIKDAGGKPDWKWFTKRYGVPVEEAPDPPPIATLSGAGKPGDKPEEGAQPGDKQKPPAKVDDKVKAKLNKLYERHEHA